MTVDPEKLRAKADKWKAKAKAAQKELAALQAKPAAPVTPTEAGVKVSRKAAHTGQWSQADQSRVAAAMKAGHPVEWTD